MDFVMQPYGVYIKTDAEGRITGINSSAFLLDTAGWMKIDEGFGDKYHHAQGNYLPGPLMDDRGVYRYKLEDGKVVERTAEEIAEMERMAAEMPLPEPDPTETRMSEIEAALIEIAAMLGGA